MDRDKYMNTNTQFRGNILLTLRFMTSNIISEPNSDYVISLRAFNDMGDGPQKYEYLRTRNEPPPQAPKVLIPPMGLKAEVLGPTSMRVSWIDTTLPDQVRNIF